MRRAPPLADPVRCSAGVAGVESLRRRWQYQLTVSDAAVAAPAVTRALVSAGADVLSIGESRHSLEDVYLELIGDQS